MHQWKMMMTFRDKWNHYTVLQTNLEALLISALLRYKTLHFVPIACQYMLAICGANPRRLVWNDYVLHITMPIELCITYPENVSVRPHQVNHCVTTFDAVLRNNLYRFFIRCSSSSNFFIRSLQMSDAFYKSSFFLNYSTLLYGEQMQ